MAIDTIPGSEMELCNRENPQKMVGFYAAIELITRRVNKEYYPLVMTNIAMVKNRLYNTGS